MVPLANLVKALILHVIWLIGLVIGLIPIVVIFQTLTNDFQKVTFWEALVVALLLTSCTGISALLLILYTWLCKQWQN
jgi:hypothetical protein